VQNAGLHVRLLAGRLPASNTYGIEMAITQDAANRLNLKVGSAVSVPVDFTGIASQPATRFLTLYVVGIFGPARPNDPFWHGETFETEPAGAYGLSFPALVSNTTFLAIFSRFFSDPTLAGTFLSTPLDLYWYYEFDISRLDINKLNVLLNGLNTTLVQIANTPIDPPYVDRTTSLGPTSLLQLYSNRIAVLRVPLQSLTLLIVALILFFVSLMTDLLVERQAPAIAQLRSRGASRRQVFTALLAQGIGISIIALLVGSLLSILAAGLLVQRTLAPVDRSAFTLITANIVQTLWGLRWLALGTVGVALLAMILSISRQVRMDVLAMRRESSRSTHAPFWQRLYLDIVAAIIALTGFGFTLYVASPGVLDAHTRVLVLPPTTLVGTLFLLLGCMLLFLRIFPFLLQQAANLAARSSGATPVLALAQMARAPRQSIRMIMLLALAVAFAIFTLVFSASQSQRIPDIAAFQVGSDFSGTISNSIFSGPLAQQVASYAHLPGVTSVTAGYEQTENISSNNVGSTIELRAVDASSYAKTVVWPQQNSSQPIAPLMAQLVNRRSTAISSQFVPAVVDAPAWQSLHLSSGAHFTLQDYHGTVNFIAIAEVNSIPTVNDTTTSVGTGDYTTAGGILIDYTTYSTIARNGNSADIEANTIWLRTRNDPHSLASVRAALSSGSLQLDFVSDRRAIIASLSNDPLYLALTGILGIGSIVALLLALLGNLTISWLSARSRLTNFAVMRALGSTPPQIASVIGLEQSIIYITAIILGLASGLLLSLIVLPAFIFTTVIVNGGQSQLTTGEFYVVQNVPPIQLVIPYGSLLIALAVLIVICGLALGIMARIASRPSISMTLRLNED
jgi:ABC-type antimicrobial peptide transport system permease subunit